MGLRRNVPISPSGMSAWFALLRTDSTAREEKTTASSRELEATLFAPCAPVEAHSPAANRPWTVVRPSMSV